MKLREMLVAALVAAITVGAIESLRNAKATQEELVPPTSGVFTGVQFSQLLGDAFRSLASLNKGSAAPANVSGAAVDGLPWLDDSSSPWALKIHADGNWPVAGYVDDVNGRWVGVLGGGTASLASATTTDLGSVAPANVTITGTTAITSFGSTAPTGVMKVIRFDSALTLTHSANLKVPGAYSLTTAADDRAVVTHLGSGAWEITHYTRANGVPIDVSQVGKVEYGIVGAAPENSVFAYGQALTRTSYPAYLAKATRAQNGTRTSGNATITSVSDTSMMGAGMPVEGTGIAAGCTIASVTSSTIVLNSSACVTSSGTATVTVFLTGYGSGGSSTTVGAPDCRGVGVSGLDTLPGSSAAGRITSASSGIAGTVAGAIGGSQTPITIAQNTLPNVVMSISGSAVQSITPTGSGAQAWYLNGSLAGSSSQFGGTGAGNVYTTAQFLVSDAISVNATVSGQTSSINGGVTQQTIAKMPPTVMMPCAVRVIP